MSIEALGYTIRIEELITIARRGTDAILAIYHEDVAVSLFITYFVN